MHMKTLTPFFILFLVVLIILESCATMKSPDKMTYERFCGTWANKDYEPTAGMMADVSYHYAKYIVNPDGTFYGISI